ncbi:hypothetical protein [Polyangium jinanense]|uniref:Uncharacterized protein n=1 Tax=Polyangium jinanense TaxID=2829994 RepID=A0A9X3X5E4_9BACT|nr:hypothetical protein [Polyangium jinanense]MDC3957231.1 hypothetical protein [Polyangium jinanense]MDC3982633.1 hypothetical protein [Polyangium jinanense]
MRMLVPPTLNLSAPVAMPAPGAVPEALRFPVGEARHLLAAYARKFAGKPRVTRDTALLQEMAERLRSLQVEIMATRASGAGIEGMAAAIGGHLALFAVELAQIRKAIHAQPTAARLASQVTRLNDQLLLYRIHFAGRPRLTGRAGLLRRSAASLADILSTLEDPELDALSDARVALCRERGRAQLRTLQNEAREIERVQAAAPLGERLRSLEHEAALISTEFQVFFEGKPRERTNLIQLAQMCDRLAEIEQQIAALFRQDHSAESARILAGVQRQLDIYEAEYPRIREAWRRRGIDV